MIVEILNINNTEIKVTKIMRDRLNNNEMTMINESNN